MNKLLEPMSRACRFRRHGAGLPSRQWESRNRVKALRTGGSHQDQEDAETRGVYARLSHPLSKHLRSTIHSSENAASKCISLSNAQRLLYLQEALHLTYISRRTTHHPITHHISATVLQIDHQNPIPLT
jgi:hypothetical protein